MKTTATSGFISMTVENPAVEIEDFERLVEQYRTRVLRFVFASVHDMDLAESLTQDCFWKAYRNRASFRGECAVNTWLMRIALNLVRDHARKRRFQFWRKASRVAVEEIRNWPGRGVSPEEKAAIDEQVQAVWKATQTLSEKQRSVFLLRFVEELDIFEIAQATGLSVNAVNVHLFRAVRGIRKKLGNAK